MLSKYYALCVCDTITLRVLVVAKDVACNNVVEFDEV